MKALLLFLKSFLIFLLLYRTCARKTDISRFYACKLIFSHHFIKFRLWPLIIFSNKLPQKHPPQKKLNEITSWLMRQIQFFFIITQRENDCCVFQVKRFHNRCRKSIQQIQYVFKFNSRQKVKFSKNRIPWLLINPILNKIKLIQCS